MNYIENIDLWKKENTIYLTILIFMSNIIYFPDGMEQLVEPIGKFLNQENIPHTLTTEVSKLRDLIDEKVRKIILVYPGKLEREWVDFGFMRTLPPNIQVILFETGEMAGRLKHIRWVRFQSNIFSLKDLLEALKEDVPAKAS